MSPYVEAIGWASAATSLYAFHCKTMIPLRVAAIAANVLSIIFSSFSGNVPTVTLNVLLLPLNVWRLFEMRRLISDVRAAAHGGLEFGWLVPYMRRMSFPAGTVIFEAGDMADAAFLIGEGTVTLPDIGVTMGQGALFGEMGLFTDGNRRTTRAVCETDVRAWTITYERFEQLYFQNPQFGLYLVRLMVQRMHGNLARAARPAPSSPPSS